MVKKNFAVIGIVIVFYSSYSKTPKLLNRTETESCVRDTNNLENNVLSCCNTTVIQASLFTNDLGGLQG